MKKHRIKLFSLITTIILTSLLSTNALASPVSQVEEDSKEVVDISSWDNPFVDMSKDDWFYEDVANLYARDIIKGTSQDRFSPGAKATKAMVATIFYRIENTSVKENEDNNLWYEDGIKWMQEKEILDGVDIKENITREDLVVLAWKNSNTPYLMDYEGLIGYKDISEVSRDAQAAFAWAHQKGYIKGRDDNTLNPKDLLTRSELASFINRYKGSTP